MNDLIANLRGLINIVQALSDIAIGADNTNGQTDSRAGHSLNNISTSNTGNSHEATKPNLLAPLYPVFDKVKEDVNEVI
jgi:hypothetical protein